MGTVPKGKPLKSLPDRPLLVDELKALDDADGLDGTAPITVLMEAGETYVVGCVILTQREAAAVVYKDGWRVLQREDRPSPPSVLEQAIESYMDEQYDDGPSVDALAEDVKADRGC